MHALHREERGFLNARNAKLHHLAKQKRNKGNIPAGKVNNQPQRPVLLSAVLKSAPQYFDSVKVACVEKYLTEIDSLPEQYQTAEILYLSQNSLHSLAGIQQFPNLRVLNASDNLLEGIEELQVLLACPNLQVASFERNPLAYLPNYRNKVLQLLPKLQMLDGQGISAQDRQRAGAALKQEAACMAVMLSNACMVHKLARTAELLQLHTELRHMLFGNSSVLARSILPSAIPLDLLKFLKIWDYEGGLSAEDRRIINDALTREVVRVHRQLQHAAMQLKGPAQMPALQAWDAAFSQVMLAQQRTIIQLVELVNVLHDEAAKLVTALTRGSSSDAAQAEAEQQRASEREGLIVDLRDAALELAGVLASNSQVVLENGSVLSSVNMPTTAPQQQLLQQMGQVQQLHSMSPQQQQLQDRAEQQQLQLLLQQQQQVQQGSIPQLADQQLKQLQQGSMRQQQQARIQPTLQEQQLPAFPPSPIQQRQEQRQRLQASSAQTQQFSKPGRRSSGSGHLRLRPAKQLSQASTAVQDTSTGTVSATTTVPVRTRQSSQDKTVSQHSMRSSTVISEAAGVADQHPEQDLQQQQQQQPACTSPGQHYQLGASGSSSKASQDRPLSPTAKRLLRAAVLVQQQQYQDEEHALLGQQQQQTLWQSVQLSASCEVPCEQAEARSGSSTQTVAEGLLDDSINACAPASPGLVLPFSSPERLSADAAGWAHHSTTTIQAGNVNAVGQPISLSCHEQQQCMSGPVSQSLPCSPMHRHQQVQPQALNCLSRSHSGTWLHSAGNVDLTQIAQSGVVYERIERFTPVNSFSPVAGSPSAPAAAASLAAACAAQACARSESSAAAASSTPTGLLNHSDQLLHASQWQQQLRSSTGPNSPNTDGSTFYTVNSLAPCSTRASVDGQAGLGSEAMASDHATVEEEQQDPTSTAAAMVAAAEAAARKLFAVENVPGTCSFFSPYGLERPVANNPSGAAGTQPVCYDSAVVQSTASHSNCGLDQDVGAAGYSSDAYAGPTAVQHGTTAAAVAGEELSFAMAGSSSPESCTGRATGHLLQQPAVQQQQPQQQQHQQLLWSLLSTDDSVEVLPSQCSPLADSSAAAITSGQPVGLNHDDPTAMLSRTTIASAALQHASCSSVADGQSAAGSAAGLPSAMPVNTAGANDQVAAVMQVSRGVLQPIPELASPRTSLAAAASHAAHHGTDTGSRVSDSMCSSVDLSPLRQRLFHSVAVSGSMEVQNGTSMGLSSLAAAVQAQEQRPTSQMLPTFPLGPQQQLLQAVQEQPSKQQIQQNNILLVPKEHLQLQTAVAPSVLATASATGSNSPALISPGGAVANRLTLEDWTLQTQPQVVPQLQHTPQWQLQLGQQLPQSQLHLFGQQLPVQHQQQLQLGQEAPKLFRRAKSVESNLSGISLVANLPSAAPSSRTAAFSAAQSHPAGAVLPTDSATDSMLASSMPESVAQPHASAAAVHASVLQHKARMDPRSADAAAASTAAVSTAGSVVTVSSGPSASGAAGEQLLLHACAQPALDLHAAAAAAVAAGALSTAAESTVGSRLTATSSAATDHTALHGAYPPFLQPVVKENSMLASNSSPGMSSAGPRGSMVWEPLLHANNSTVLTVNSPGSTAVSSHSSLAWPQQQQQQQAVAAAGTVRTVSSPGDAVFSPRTTVSRQQQQQPACAGTSREAANSSAGVPSSQRSSVAWQQQAVLVGNSTLAASNSAGDAAASTDGSSAWQQQPVLAGNSTMAMTSSPAIAAASPRTSFAWQQSRISAEGPTAAVQPVRNSAASGPSTPNAAVGNIFTQQPAAAACVPARSSQAQVTVAESVAAAVAAAAAGGSSLSTELMSPSRQRSMSALPATLPKTGALEADVVATHEAEPSTRKSEALAVGRAQSPGERKAQLLQELQDRLVTLAVEKAALEKELQVEKGQLQVLQQKAMVSEHLQATLQQTEANLTAAQQMLQETGGLAERQAQQNEQLRAQLAQMQAEAELEQCQQAAAENMARRALCRRMLVSLTQAAKASIAWRELKAKAALHGQRQLHRRALKHWHAAAVHSRQLQVLRIKQQHRQLRAVLAEWSQFVLMQRLDSAQTAAATDHWAARNFRRVLSHWRFYAYQSKQLGLELPSSPSTCSECSAAEHEQRQFRLALLSPQRDVSFAGNQSKPRCSKSVAAVQAAGLKQRLQAAQQMKSLIVPPDVPGSPMQNVQSSADMACAALSPRSQSQNRSLTALSARLSAVLSPRGRKAVGAECLSAADAEDNASLAGTPSNAAVSSKSNSAAISVAWADVCEGKLGPPEFRRHQSSSSRLSFNACSGGPAAYSRRQSVSFANAAAADDIPVDVQLSFSCLAKAQRLRRRWMLVKAWNRWQQLLQTRDVLEQLLAAASSRYSRRLQRRALVSWLQYTQYKQAKKTSPDAVSNPSLLHIAVKHWQLKQHALLFRVVQGWCLQAYRIVAARRIADRLAAEKQRRLKQQVLQVLQRHVQYCLYKRQLLQKAEHFRMLSQLRLVWQAWSRVVAETRAGAAQHQQNSQQMLHRAALRWQHLSVALTAAHARHVRLQRLQDRVELRRLTNALQHWKCFTLQSINDQKAAGIAQLQQQVQIIQQQRDQEHQEVTGLAELQQQLLSVQEQLEAALAMKTGLEQVVQHQKQELGQQVATHKQQLSELNNKHQAAANIMQKSLDDAATTADEATQQLQQLQLQQANQQLEQQLKYQQLEHQIQQHQQRQQQLESREQELLQQLAASKAQRKELAGQLKRCSDKLNQQTQIVQSLKSNLESVQEQLAIATSASRDQNLNFAQQAIAAEKDKFKSQQLLHNEQATILKLRQHVQVLEQQLQEQKAAADNTDVQHRLDIDRMAENLALKDQTIQQLQGSMAGLQGKLSEQQAKVLAEVAQLRNGWSQAKSIIKQQRRTIKQQEVQLQLAINGVAPSAPSLQNQQQQIGSLPAQQQHYQQYAGCSMPTHNAPNASAGLHGTWGAVRGSSTYPITTYVLQSQQQKQQAQPGPAAGTASEQAATATAVPGSLAWAVQHGTHSFVSASEPSRQATSVQHVSKGAEQAAELLGCTDEILANLKAVERSLRTGSC